MSDEASVGDEKHLTKLMLELTNKANFTGVNKQKKVYQIKLTLKMLECNKSGVRFS